MTLAVCVRQADRSGWQSTTICEIGHGRIEIRILTSSTELTNYFAREWPGIAQVFRLEHLILEKGGTSHFCGVWTDQQSSQ